MAEAEASLDLVLFDEIMNKYEDLERIPRNLHLFCPQVGPDDCESYEDPDEPGDDITVDEKKKRIADSVTRRDLAVSCSLLLGVSKEQSSFWLPQWQERTEQLLTTCSDCIKNWQRDRKPFLKRILGKYGENYATIMESKLNDFDKERIDRGLGRAADILRREGPMKHNKLLKKDTSAVLALYEALCCMPFLAMPENRAQFHFVFHEIQKVKRPLRLGTGIIPSMTWFLFQEDDYKTDFARAAWESVEAGSLTADQFDWAVNEYLAAEIEAMSRPDATDLQIRRFWDGIAVILPAMSEDFVIHTLRGMQTQPDIYGLAILHLTSHHRASASLLATILKTICALLRKSSKAFWGALQDLPPHVLAGYVWGHPSFPELLSRALDSDMLVQEGQDSVPLPSYFVKTLLVSLQTAQRNDVCESITHQLLEVFKDHPKISPLGRAVCTSTALTALACVLKDLADVCAAPHTRSTAMMLIYIGTACNIVLKYKNILVDSLSLRPDDQHNVGLPEAALEVVSLALSLDAETYLLELMTIKKGKEMLQHEVKRRSPELWDAFTEALHPYRTSSLAKVMIKSTMPFRKVERFLALKHDHGQVKDPQRQNFNVRFGTTADAVGRLIGRVSEFPTGQQTALLSDDETMEALAGCLLHGNESISGAAVEFIKSYTGEDARSDALEKMVHAQPERFLNAFSDSLAKKIPESHLHDYDMFAPVPGILSWSRDLREALCDTTSGFLRSRKLTEGEAEAVKYWWKRQWAFAGYFFNTTKSWATNYIERAHMEEHCRRAVEHADALLAEDGLVASAISRDSQQSGEAGAGATAAAMKIVLEEPRVISQSYMMMLQLRDEYLLGVFARSVVKLLHRLREYRMDLPTRPLESLRSICRRGADGKYATNSNLNGQQKADLMRALGQDADDEEQSSAASTPTAVPSAQSVVKAQAKKQSSLDAWSRSGPASVSGSSVASTASTTRPPSIMQSLTAPRKPKISKVLDASTIKATQASMREARAREQAEKDKSRAAARAHAQAIRDRINNKTVPGEGSALQGMTGVLGKDSALPKSEIMVDSSSEEEDDDEDADDDMAGIMSETLAGRQEAERRRKVLAAKPVGPVKKVKIERSKKDLRARITPPMERLHEAILGWNIHHEGNDPPNGYSCREVAKIYRTPIDYRETFFPLLVNEAWRSFVTSKDESTAKPFDIKVINRVSVDKFMEVTTSMPQPAAPGPGKEKDRDRLGDGDIVLMSTARDPLSDKEAPHCLARVFKTAWKKSMLEVTFRLTARGPIIQALNPGADMRGLRITNMNTVEREYAALESLQYYDLLDEVLSAEPSPVLTFGDERIKSIINNYQLNRGQAVAIINALENDGFTLVQGPPGTGKTKTIVAMVGALLTGKIKLANAKPTVPVKAPGSGGPAEIPMAKKLLICAPSNAAVDELVLRLKAGVKDVHGQSHNINVLRLGRSDAINAAVKDVTLDELVQQKMNAALKINGGEPSEREKLHKQAGEIKTRLTAVREALDALEAAPDADQGQVNNLRRQRDELRRSQMAIGTQIDRSKESGNTFAREAELQRRRFQQEVLSGAHVLCATLSGAGHDMFKTLQVEFETVIIDEAAQCVELSALIPLKYGCSKCVLVGDPKQLPPTVLSQSAAQYGYDQSLFVRMQQNHPGKVHLLDCQYRMHPEISLFPSQTFYDGRLADGNDMATLRHQPWHANPMLGPYRFFDVEGIQERGGRGQSLVNQTEINVAQQIYLKLAQDYKRCFDPTMAGAEGGDAGGKNGAKIGIITPYKAQLHQLRQKFRDRFGESVFDQVEFNTTDAFQGRECEIIIFSCVRASPKGGIGFMTDIRRMNVGLTRARSSLWILGDSRALKQGPFWAKLIEDAQKRGHYTSRDIIASLRNSKGVGNPSAHFKAPLPIGMPAADVEMTDAPPLPGALNNPQPPAASRASQPNTPSAPLAQRQTRPLQAQQLHALDGVPTIQSTTGGMPRKRPAPPDDRGAPGGGLPPKRKPAPPPPKQKPKMTDPSAMQALGLAPPERPMPPPPPSRPIHPPRKKPPNPFMPKKPAKK